MAISERNQEQGYGGWSPLFQNCTTAMRTRTVCRFIVRLFIVVPLGNCVAGNRQSVTARLLMDTARDSDRSVVPYNPRTKKCLDNGLSRFCLSTIRFTKLAKHEGAWYTVTVKDPITLLSAQIGWSGDTHGTVLICLCQRSPLHVQTTLQRGTLLPFLLQEKSPNERQSMQHTGTHLKKLPPSAQYRDTVVAAEMPDSQGGVFLGT